MSTSQTDKELLKKIAKNCEESFEILFNRYHSLLYQYAYKVFKDRATADEVVHKTFIKIWKLRTGLPEIQSFKNYIFSVNKNLVVDELKAISRNRNRIDELKHRIVSFHNKVEEDAIFNDLEGIANAAIEELPKKRKEIFKLSRYEGYSHKEIAHMLNISENTVKVSVYKSLKQIRKYMTLNADMSFPLLIISLPYIL